MFKKYKLFIILFFVLALLAWIFPWKSTIDLAKFQLMNKKSLHVAFNMVNPGIRTLTADPSNKLVLRVTVRDSSDRPVPKAKVQLSSDNGIGTIVPSSARTDNSGECLVTYIPPDYTQSYFSKGNVGITLRAGIAKSSTSPSITFQLAPVPVVLIHGYQSNETVFTNFLEYLSKGGFQCSALKYDSLEGVVKGGTTLGDFVKAQRLSYLSQGCQVNRFDLIAHSMGGLVARYYTCSSQYIGRNDVRKIIFIAVPQKGSPWAPLGLSYFQDQGIQDLVPDNDLLTKAFPAMLNKGLNSRIQVGSIRNQFDEVVSPESASLDEWGIKTEVFAIGESNFNVDNILSGNFAEATNHMAIINNMKVFEKVAGMLNSKLPYPRVKSR